MAHAPTDPAPNPLAAAAAGLVAGLVASFVMDRFQAGVASLSSSDSEAEPATEKAADKLSQVVTGHDVPDDRKPLAGQAVHYALGAGLGVVYAVAAEYRPAVTTGYGTAFALANTALLDEAAVPAVSLGDAPWNAAPSTHLYSVASHLVFGTVTEGVRRLLRGMR
jgi:uncharacterized membrane protein YagU involved in acid resistance